MRASWRAGRLLTAAVLGTVLAAACSGAPLTDRGRQVRLAVRQAMLETRATGCSVAIAQDGRVVFEHGFGYADVEDFSPVRPQTVFRIASISKPITAVAVMQLVEKGKVGLDEDIRRYVPEFPDKGETITPRQVLAHLSGIRGYRGNEWANRDPYSSVEQALALFAGDPLEHRPGEKYLYSTHAYTLAARLVERVSGVSFPQYLMDNIFRPAGMTSTGPEDLRSIVRWRARGYARDSEGNLVNSAYTDISYKWAGGGLVSTAADLCRFGSALLNGKLLGPEARETMWEEQRTLDGKGTGYALGWVPGTAAGRPSVAHGGAQPAARSFLLLVPGERLVVAVLSNYEGFQPSGVARRIAEIWLAGGDRDRMPSAPGSPAVSSSPVRQ